ncbi:MAG TPA: HU family DNA-binding protein [Gemmatimonadales bacterium]|nr:HU family DNA-binding protein [Gemmatimonadales bacterium]
MPMFSGTFPDRCLARAGIMPHYAVGVLFVPRSQTQPHSRSRSVNKEDFADKLAKKVDISKTKAMDVIDCVFSTKPRQGIIATELDAGRDVTITGFGTFRTRKMKARKGRNPQTGKEIMIKARKTVSFRAGKGLKDRVKE